MNSQLGPGPGTLGRMTCLIGPFCIAIGCLFSTLNSAAAEDLEKVRISLVNGSSIRATIKSIDASGVVAGTGLINGISLDEIVKIETGRSVNPPKTSSYLMLQMGGRHPMKQVSCNNDQVEIASNEFNRGYPLEVVQAIVWSDSPKVIEAISAPSSEFDMVIVTTSRGETAVQGLLESINDTHVVIDYKGESKKISLEKVKAVVAARLSSETSAGAKASVSLTDGSKIIGMINELSEGKLVLSVGEKYSLSIQTEEISTIAIQSKRVRYLSDLEPISYEEQSQFAVPRTWRRDLSVLGNQLRLKQNSTGRVLEFEKGIGARSYSALTFQNDGQFSHFRTVVGIDMETEGHGDCEMVVEGDGIKLWSKRVSGLDDPEPVVVEIKDISEIKLIVRPGEYFDLADHADWAEARFTKSK